MRRRSTLPSGLNIPRSPNSPAYSHDYKQVPPHVAGNIKEISYNPLYGDAPATTFDPPLPSLPRTANGESITLPSDAPPPLYEEVSASRRAAKLAQNPQYGAVGGANGATPNPKYEAPPTNLSAAGANEEHMYASLHEPSQLVSPQHSLQYAQPYEHVQSSQAPPTVAPPTGGVAILTDDNVSYNPSPPPSVESPKESL